MPDPVEANPTRPRPRSTECGRGRQNDVGLDRLQRFVIELHRSQRLRRQVGDHHVRPRDQSPQHLLPFSLHRVECDAFLVAIDLEEQRAFAARAHWSHETVFAAASFLHADHLRAEFRKQCRAIGPRDIAPEIEHPHPLQNSTHSTDPFLQAVLL